MGDANASRGIDAGDTAAGKSGIAYLYNPGDTGSHKQVTGHASWMDDGGSVAYHSTFGGAWQGGTGAIDGVRFIMSSGNIASGSFKLYGIDTTV